MREGVPEGLYFLKFRYVKDCGWDESATVGEPDVHLWVTTERIPDGTQAEFRVFGRFQAMKLKPLAELKATLQNDQATAVWQYRQKLNEPPGGEFLFEVRVDKMRAVSGALEIWPFPVVLSGRCATKIEAAWIRPRTDGREHGTAHGSRGPEVPAFLSRIGRGWHPGDSHSAPELSVATEF